MREAEFPYGEIEEKIGYVFRDKSLLRLAFVHSTWSNAHGGENNERLEFLGVAVLELIVSERLYRFGFRGRALNEGEMTDARQRLVSQKAIAGRSGAWNWENICFSRAAPPTSAKRRRPACSSLSSAAIYLDPGGGYPAAEKFVSEHLELSGEENYKKRLQELLQGKRAKCPNISR